MFSLLRNIKWFTNFYDIKVSSSLLKNRKMATNIIGHGRRCDILNYSRDKLGRHWLRDSREAKCFKKGSLIQLNIGELSNSKAITSLFGSTNLYQFHTSN